MSTPVDGPKGPDGPNGPDRSQEPFNPYSGAPDSSNPTPPSGQYPAQPGSGEYRGSYGPQPWSGQYPAQPQSGQYPARPLSGQYPPSTAQSWAQPPVKKSKKGLFIGLGALAVVVVLVAGYFVFFAGFGGIKNSAGKIENAKEFLSTTEKEWKGALPKDGISVSKSAGCFYQLDKDDAITEKVYCGPARRSSTKSGQTWDEFSYSVTGSGDKQSAGDLKPGKVSQAMPANLVDVEGSTPTDDGKSIKEPPLPELAKETVWTSDSYTVADPDKGNSATLGTDARLVAPGIEATIKDTSEYNSATVDGRLSKAASGEVLYQVSVSATKGAINGSVNVAYAVSINGQEQPLDVPALSTPKFDVLISAPKSGTVLLVLDCDGYKQSIDISNGKRSDKPVNPLLYAPVAPVSPGTVLTYPKQPAIDALEVDLTATITSASLVGYDSTQGFPSDGMAWLIIEFDDAGTIYSADGNSGYTSYTLGCSAITANGTTAKKCTPSSGNVTTVVIQVDATARSFAISMPLDIHASGPGKPDFDVAMAAQSTTIAFA